MCLQFIHRFGLAQKVSANGGVVSFKDLAQECGLNEDDMKRMLRLAMTDHIFCEVEPGIVGHTSTSQILVTNPGLFAWMGVTTQENWPSMFRVCSRNESLRCC